MYKILAPSAHLGGIGRQPFWSDMEGDICDTLLFMILELPELNERERNACHHAVRSAVYVICGGLALLSSQIPTQLLTNSPLPNRTRVENRMKNLMGQNKDREIV